MRRSVLFTLSALSIVTVVATGCSSTSAAEKKSVAPRASQTAGDDDAANKPANKTADKTTPKAKAKPAAVQEKHVQKMVANFSRVHFETDSSILDDDSRSALKENAQILDQHPDLTVEVQGHADERGTDAYNLSLGDRRAQAVRDYLVRMGVEDKRIHSVSYGEERPIAKGTSAKAWAKNRRAEFKVIKGDAKGTTS